MSIILAQFGAKTENLRVSKVWPSDRLGMMRNATRKDSGVEARLFGIVLRLPRYWNRVRKFLVIFSFSSRFACTGNRRLCATSF